VIKYGLAMLLASVAFMSSRAALGQAPLAESTARAIDATVGNQVLQLRYLDKSPISCAVQRHGLPVGANPTRQLSLQPVAIGAVAQGEAAEAFGVEGHFGDSANMQAVMRMNVEQASKRLMRKPTRRNHGEGCCFWGSER
jgi:hypothetical protein